MYFNLRQLKEYVEEKLLVHPEETPIIAYILEADDVYSLHPETGERLSPTDEQRIAIMKELGVSGECTQLINEMKDHAVFQYRGY